MSFLTRFFRGQTSTPTAAILNRGDQFMVTIDGVRYDGDCAWGNGHDKKLMLVANSLCRVPSDRELTHAEKAAIADAARTALIAHGNVGCPVVVV